MAASCPTYMAKCNSHLYRPVPIRQVGSDETLQYAPPQAKPESPKSCRVSTTNAGKDDPKS